MFEIGYAYKLHKTIILACDDEFLLDHPFIRMATTGYQDVSDALRFLQSIVMAHDPQAKPFYQGISI
jgi:hypothetical protein